MYCQRKKERKGYKVSEKERKKKERTKERKLLARILLTQK